MKKTEFRELVKSLLEDTTRGYFGGKKIVDTLWEILDKAQMEKEGLLRENLRLKVALKLKDSDATNK